MSGIARVGAVEMRNFTFRKTSYHSWNHTKGVFLVVDLVGQTNVRERLKINLLQYWIKPKKERNSDTVVGGASI